MGCGKSKHAVETANTVVKSTNSDCTKETINTKTITEKGDAIIHKKVETNNVYVQDTTKETGETKIDSSDVSRTHNMAPISAENIDKATKLFKEADTIRDSNPDNLTPSSTENTGKAVDFVQEEGNIEANTNNTIASPVKDDVGTAEVVEKDEEKVGSSANEIKTEKEPPTEERETKEPKITKDNMTKTEFMTPTLSEDVVGPFQVVKDDEEVRESQEDNLETEITNKKSSDDNLIVEEQMIVAGAVETKKEDDVEVIAVDIANVKTITEQENITIADEVNVAEAYEKEP